MGGRGMNTDLPWYLHQVLGNDDHDLTASSNAFQTAKITTKPCSFYEEEDLDPSRGSTNQITADTSINMKLDTRARNCQRTVSAPEPEQADQIKLQRQRKRSRFQSDIFEPSHKDGERNDRNIFDFKPFTGSMEELAAQQRHFNTYAQLLPSLQYSDPYSWIQWRYLILLLCWMAIVCIPIRRHKKYENSDDGTPSDAAPSLLDTFSEGEKGAKDELTSASMTLAARNKSRNESAPAISNNLNRHVPANEYVDVNEKTVESGCNAVKLESIFTTDIPAMAHVISLTGLSRQDSIRIATQEVLATRRRYMEQELEMERERVNRSKLKADQAMQSLRDCVLSTLFGSNLMLCVFLACTIRFIACNKDTIYRLSFEHDIDAGSEILDIIYNWFISDICKCLEESCAVVVEIDNHNRATSNVAFGMNILTLLGIPSFASLFYSTSTATGRCIVTCIAQVFFVGVMHKILRMFHSIVLHQFFNFVIVGLIAFKTIVGRSLMQLIIEIFVSNAACCAIVYGSILSKSMSIKCDDDYFDNEKTRGQRLMDYQAVAELASNLKPRLLLTSSIGFVLLATR